ncbi:Legionella secretion system protein Y [Legionella geestiana]|uniref:Legionella secretion system protein Y n=1 Tax=Legionella geestiana TaxID=45065 RepID=A0A0W0U8X3_9GAMM|nr:VTT domain-containing protein [Legionella geestiana]KTD04225.1 Legionella secretion system protein Y [Legionella geestiana]QBS11645.1 hypothetical protein E4T54_02205 [Legionella geestiana]QDQ40744.1 hypothetical protein E3226_010215 [Legionella geestiana]STX53670.1 Legionella secretion system protein Y [Legionella geestiana]
MHLLTEYIQPLTDWLHGNPRWALLITFLISFSESLAIIGSIIPGSVTMTAIGILAGSGVMRVDLTLLAAILGAIAGDSASYILGFACRDQLQNVWPFRRYPAWLALGREYFERHGGKSVLIGRFVGPLRSLIPVIAGMLHMNQYRFFFANVLSAIGWSLLYMLPGILIGAASNELSPESATKLFVGILLVIAFIWLCGLLLKYLMLRIYHLLQHNLGHLCAPSSRFPKFSRFIQGLAPVAETELWHTAGLLLLGLVSLLALLVVVLAFTTGKMLPLDRALFYFFQTLRTPVIDAILILAVQFTSTLALCGVAGSIAMRLYSSRDWHGLQAWLLLCVVSLVLALSAAYTSVSPGFSDLPHTASALPEPHLLVQAALFFTLMFAARRWCPPLQGRILASLLGSLLILGSLSFLWLGDTWFSAALASLLSGFLLAVCVWIFWRREARPVSECSTVALLTTTTLLVSATLSAVLFFRGEWKAHSPFFAQYVVSENAWWTQTRPLLPLYRTNRFGQRISLFNLQYAGQLAAFSKALRESGWQAEPDSFLNTLARQMDSSQPLQTMPMMSQLYHNRKPVLVMRYNPTDGTPSIILRLWRSNFHLLHANSPLWLGSVHAEPAPRGAPWTADTALTMVERAMKEFYLREYPLTLSTLKPLPIPSAPRLLLISETRPLSNKSL